MLDSTITSAAIAHQFHPASEIFDLLSGRDFEDLTSSIRKNGLREPIWLHPDGSILDGRNRYRACLAGGVTPAFNTWDGVGSEADFVWDLNFARRHLDGGAKQMAAGRYAIELEREARERQGARTDLTSAPIDAEVDFGRSREKAAEKFGLGTKTVERAVTVAKSGTPELIELVERDDVSVSAAAEVARLPEPEQKEIVARGEQAIVEAAKFLRNAGKLVFDDPEETIRAGRKFRDAKAQRIRDQRAAANAEKAKGVASVCERYRLVQGSVELLLSEPAESVDIIMTDPPYAEAAIPLYGRLAVGAAHILKPGGLLLCISGTAWLPSVIAQLEGKGLTYLWTIAYLTGGNVARVFPRRATPCWNPVFVYSKGAYEGEFYSDVVRSSDGNDHQHHVWGQSVSGMRDLMQRFVFPGHVVVDPFLGGGTTAVVALEFGATFLGFDVDQTAIDATKSRLA